MRFFRGVCLETAIAIQRACFSDLFQPADMMQQAGGNQEGFDEMRGWAAGLLRGL